MAGDVHGDHLREYGERFQSLHTDQHEFHPDGFNIGVNDSRAAGQTIPHAHTCPP